MTFAYVHSATPRWAAYFYVPPQHSTPAEHSAIDSLIARGGRLAGEMDRDVVQSLHQRGLIYVDVPVASDDLISGTFFFLSSFLSVCRYAPNAQYRILLILSSPATGGIRDESRLW